MTAESKDLIASPRSWNECAIGMGFFARTLYCRIETPTGKVVFGKFDQDPNGRAWYLYIPLLFNDNAKHRNLISTWPSEKLDNLRTSRMAEYNRDQFTNFRNHEASYIELGTTTSREFFGVTKSCSSVGIPATDYNLYLSTSLPADRDIFVRQIESKTNWKIEPATFEELEDLTRK